MNRPDAARRLIRGGKGVSFEWLIAWRYLKAKRKQKFISISTWISVAGVAVGVTALIVVLAVMSGFEADLRDKILGTTSHVVVLKHGFGGIKDYRQIVEEIEATENVAAAAPFVLSQVMVRTDFQVAGAVLRGVDVEREGRVTDLKRKLVAGDVAGLAKGSQNKETAGHVEAGGEGDRPAGIVIGRELALNLGVKVGSTVTVISPLGDVTPLGTVPRLREFEVVGIFETGMYEYDAGLAYVSMETAQRFFGMDDVATGIEVKVEDIYLADAVADELEEKLGYPYWSRDWKEMNRTLFSALRLEQVVMFVILVLIVLVAAFNIISSLVMMVMEKGKDIAILKAMGATRRAVMRIFILEGLIIGCTGTIIGFASGFVVCRLLDRYQFIRLPSDIYYLETLPVRMEALDVVLIILAAVVMSFLATLYPSWSASRVAPVDVLRYE